MTDEPIQNPVTYDNVGINVDPELSRFERLSEIGSAMGTPGRVGDIEVPPPCLMSMALLESIDSPFVCPSESDEPREVTRKHVLEALYILTFPEAAVAPIDSAMRARAALSTEAKRAAQKPELWDCYLEQLADTGRRAYGAFDAAMWTWSATLPAVDVEALAGELAAAVALASRGYALVRPKANDDKKKAATSQSTASSGYLSTLWPYIARLAVRCMRLFLRSR